MKLHHFLSASFGYRFFILLLFFKLCEGQQMTGENMEELSGTEWSTHTYINELSPDGQWVVYTDVFPMDRKITYLQHTSGNLKQTLGNIRYSHFTAGSGQLAFINSDKEFVLIDLKTQLKKVISEVSSFEMSCSEKFIAVVKETDDRYQHLLIINQKREIVREFERLQAFSWHPSSEMLALITENDSISHVFTYDILSDQKTGVLENIHFPLSGFKWSNAGNAFLVYGNESLIYHHLQWGKKILDLTLMGKYFPDYAVSKYEYFLSDDEEGVYFYRNKADIPKDEWKGIQVWKSSDPWNLPKMEQYRERIQENLLTLWVPEQNELYEVATSELPDVRLSPSSYYVLSSNRLQYEPQYNISQEADLYLKNVLTGEKKLVIEKQNNTPTMLSFSPDGHYIAYFHGSNWFVYDVKCKVHIRLTGSHPDSFAFSEEGYSDKLVPYGNPGWTSDGQLILYDHFDIWLFSPDGRFSKRITNGRENKTIYRISSESYFDAKTSTCITCQVYDFNDLIVEIQYENLRRGFGLLSKNKELKPVAFGAMKFNNILISEDKNVIVYTKSRYNFPFAVYVYNRNENKETLLYESNTGFPKESTGKSETVFYQSESGKDLRASLIYPSGYDPTKKYPMVVWVYENHSEKVLQFNPPHDFNPNGFNILMYTTNGYFVLLPDIDYKIGEPGISALNSITAAVNKTAENASVDIENIGLIGHSFGGYETAFIATQTKIFKTVVAGAGVYDFRSFYHDIQWYGWNLEQMWRFENQQFRMGGSYYELKAQYENNSPLSHVENLQTPVLLWTGKEDSQVHWTQSIYFYNAMKRLNKESELLLLDKENHTINKPENQKFLSRYIFDWFEKYLK